VSEVQDASNFYVRMPSNSACTKIDDAMDNFDPQSADNLERPINKGTLCAAKFSEDGSWYRARVSGLTGGK
jgi:hypothetical protein